MFWTVTQLYVVSPLLEIFSKGVTKHEFATSQDQQEIVPTQNIQNVPGLTKATCFEIHPEILFLQIGDVYNYF